MGTLVILATLTAPVLMAAPLGDRSPLLSEAAGHLAFIFPGLIALLWLLSRRLEMLTRSQARAELLAEEATIDVLTGVANRRRSTDELDLLIANARRYQWPLSVASVDIDHFKRVNDTYGHDVGDRVLIEFARRLQHVVRATDVVGRWGGEEFAVAPEAGLEEAEQLAHRCRDQVRDRPFSKAGAVTASFGVVELEDDDDRRTLLRRADLALYTAKREGRDRVGTINGFHSPAELPTPDQASSSRSLLVESSAPAKGFDDISADPPRSWLVRASSGSYGWRSVRHDAVLRQRRGRWKRCPTRAR